MKQKKKIKVVIVVLAVLLCLSLLALGGTLLYNKLANGDPAAVTVPDNLITPSGDSKKSDGDEKNTDSAKTENKTVVAETGAATSEKAEKAASIELYNRQPEENTAFKVENMFPGDSITKYFRVRVSYHDKVTVHYKATVRPGFEKLAEVLKVRVKLLTTGETLYDGVIADMPESVTHKLQSRDQALEELYYEVTAYLDTNVGNEYQNKNLCADFKWWVEETGNLDDSPMTGDFSSAVPWATVAVCCGSALLFLFIIRKRKEDGKDA